MPDAAASPTPAARRRAAPLSHSREKLFYSISEAAAQLDVAAHVLRYWETQFSMLRPRKSRAGSRMYQPRDLDTLRTIKKLLYDEGMTIAGARRKMLAERRAAPAGETLAPAAASHPSPNARHASPPRRVATAPSAVPHPPAAAAPQHGAGAVADAGQTTLAFAPGAEPALDGATVAEVAAVRDALREIAAGLRAPRPRTRGDR